MKKYLAALLVTTALLLPNGALAAIAFDAATNGGTSGTTSLTFSHTTTGSNRILIVSVGKIDDGDVVTGVTYAGTAMTKAIAQPWPPNANSRMELWYLFAPATGANNVVITVSSNTNQVAGAAASYTGALQSGTPDTGFTSENASGARTVTVNVTTANSWLVSNYKSADADPTAGTGTGRVGTPAGNPNIMDSNAAVGSGNQTIGYTWDVSDRHIMLAMAFAPAASAAVPADFGDLTLFGDW